MHNGPANSNPYLKYRESEARNTVCPKQQVTIFFVCLATKPFYICGPNDGQHQLVKCPGHRPKRKLALKL